ncbi:methylenetetrahydrofolate reductase [NAD(P)H] [Candidatus Margulisiibacteriota bacterium]
MKVINALQKDEPALSFEFFPPKTEKGEGTLLAVVSELKKFKPDFVSVTCGAMGSTHEKTFYWIKQIKERCGLEPVAHLTCAGIDQDGIIKQINQLEKLGVDNILALRGDPPAGQDKFVAPENGFNYARELVALIKRHSKKICIGVAGYPEGHPEAPSIEIDIEHLKEKVEAGADYIITQLFFDNRYFFDFQARCKKAGINIPIIPGIMPITSMKQMGKITGSCGASVPGKLFSKLEQHSADPEAIKRMGVEHTVAQCQELLEAEVPGLHFFVMNQAGPITQILSQVKSFLRQ